MLPKERVRHLTANLVHQRWAHQAAVIGARDDLNRRVASQLLERSGQLYHGAFEIKRVQAPRENVQLAFEFWPQVAPPALEHETDVIPLPGASDLGVNPPRGSVPELARLPRFVERTE